MSYSSVSNASEPSRNESATEADVLADSSHQNADSHQASSNNQLPPKLLDIVTSQRDRFRAR